MTNDAMPGSAEAVRRQFKRCDEETIEAIIRFRAGRDPHEIRAIMLGIISRYLPPADREALKGVTPEMLLSDLHIESLTMLEIILDIQDALDIVIEDAEMRQFTTLGDVERFLEKKVTDASAG